MRLKPCVVIKRSGTKYLLRLFKLNQVSNKTTLPPTKSVDPSAMSCTASSADSNILTLSRVETDNGLACRTPA